jgi:hypothetical protein
VSFLAPASIWKQSTKQISDLQSAKGALSQGDVDGFTSDVFPLLIPVRVCERRVTFPDDNFWVLAFSVAFANFLKAF